MNVERRRVSLSDGLAAKLESSWTRYTERRAVRSIGFSKMKSKE